MLLAFSLQGQTYYITLICKNFLLCFFSKLHEIRTLGIPQLVFMFLFLCNTAASGEDKEANENENVAIPLLMRNALPDVEGFEKNEKLDIAMRPEQVSRGDSK